MNALNGTSNRRTRSRREAHRRRADALNAVLSVVLSASMTLQGLTYAPARAYATDGDGVDVTAETYAEAYGETADADGQGLADGEGGAGDQSADDDAEGQAAGAADQGQADVADDQPADPAGDADQPADPADDADQPANDGGQPANEPAGADAAPDGADEDRPLASVARSEDGPMAVNVHGQAAENPDDAVAALSLLMSGSEAEDVASKLLQIQGSGSINGEHGAPSTSEKVNELCGKVTSDAQRMGDGISISTFKLQWATPDSPAADPDEDPDQLSIATTSDGKLSVMTEINYSISAGGAEFPPDTIHIYVPATLIFKRGGQTMAGELNIPYAEYPSRLNDYNWRQVGDYVVLSNAIPMDGSSAGYIQIEWANVVPHEVVDEDVSDPWYGYIEVDTPSGKTLKATSGNELTAQIDTAEKVTAANKRVQTGYPKRVDNDGSVIPTSLIPAEHQDEAEFVVVDWYVWAHYNGNQPFSLDVADALDTTYNGFIYKIDSGTVTRDPDDPSKATATGVYDGYPGKENGDSGYVHVYSAYPFSQFEHDVKYELSNTVTYTLNPKDGADDSVTATKSATATFVWHQSSWHEANGEFIIWKWGNDGPTGMVAHNPQRESTTVSRRGANARNYAYQSWYGIYDDGINQLLAENSDGVSLYYTVYSGGLFIPLSLKRPESGLVEGNWQWAKWNSTTKSYESAETIDPGWTYDQASRPDGTDKAWPVDTAQTGGYELVPYTWVLANYLQKPVTVVTEGAGNYFGGTVQTADDHNQSISGGTKLTPGTDYVFKSVEFDKPSIGKIAPSETKESRSLGYANESDAAKIPTVYVQTEVNGTWQQSGNDPDAAGFDWYAKVDWTSGKQVITYKNPAGGESSSVVTLPAKCTNFRTVVKSEGIASFELNAYPELHLNSSDAVRQLAADTFGTDDDKVYNPSVWIYNGAHCYGYTYDDEGAITTQPAERTRFGEDRIDGYSSDVAVFPSKKYTFNSLKDVDYTAKQATVHYEAKIEERTFIADRATYEEALDKGTVAKEEKGVWYDLLPKGMVLDRSSVTLRDGDTYSRIIERPNWNGTGRTLVVIPVSLTPTPTAYKQSVTDATSYWEDVPTIKFDATMDLDTWVDMGGNPEAAMEGIVAHNVVAFESGNDTLGTVDQYAGEPNKIDQANAGNVHTKTGRFSDEEKAAFEAISVDKALGVSDDYRTTPSFVYAECSTTLAFPTAGRASLSKSVSVDGGASYGTGLYDDVRDAYVGGTYSYRLRMVSSQDTKSKNLILFDSLETYVPSAGDDETDVGAPSWQGTFLKVDTSALEDAGCAPVVYYSTVADLALSDPDDVGKPNEQNTDLTNTSVWSTTCPSDPADVTAVAIDCRKAADGSDFALLPGESLSAEVVMRAPSGSAASGYVDQDAHAYNDLFLTAYTVEADLDFRPDPEDLDFIHASYTKVGLKKYQVPVKKVWSDDYDRDGMRPDSVTVTLFANGVVAGPDITSKSTLVLNEGNGWSGVFEDIPYTDPDGATITYTVVERTDTQPSDVPAGYTARTTGYATTGYTVTNRHVPVKVSVSGTKTWAGDDPATRPAYIDLVLLADGAQVANKRIYPNEDGTWPTHTFTGLNKYRDHGTEIAYTVDEIVSDAAYAPTITGEGGDFGVLNTYHPYGDVDLTKYVIGATAKVLSEDRDQSKQYQFQVKLEVPLTDDEGNPVLDDGGKQAYGPLTGDYELESRIGDAEPTDAGTVSDGGTVTITAGGSYTLDGETTQVDPETITIKDLPHNARVTFTEEDYSGQGFTTATGRVQTVTVTQNRTAKVAYTNIYRAKGQADLEAKKTLDGKTLEAGTFNFEVLDEKGNVVGVQATNKANGTVTFGTIHYTAADDGKTYHYTIREVIPGEAKNDAGTTYAEATEAERTAGGFKLRGVEYDQSEHGVTVTVNDVDGNGKLTVVATYDENDNTRPVFTNTYTAEGTADLVAWKTLKTGSVERELQDGEFSFELIPLSGNESDGTAIEAANIPMSVDDQGTRLAKDTQTNDAQGTVRFGTIKYTQFDVGNTYYYVVSEAIPTNPDPDIEYSTSIFCYKVTIVDNGDGTLYADQSMVRVTKSGDSYTIGDVTEAQPEFVNKLKRGGLRLEKLIQGDNPDPNQEFTFHVILKGDVVPNYYYSYRFEEAIGDPGDFTTLASQEEIKEEEQNTLPEPLQFLQDLLAPTEVQAAEGDITYSGTFGHNDGVTWELYEDGELVIRPTDGNEATWSRSSEGDRPWLDAIPTAEQSNINSITFKKTIHVSGTLSKLVTGSANTTIKSLDVSGLETSGITTMANAFNDLRGCTTIRGLDKLNTSNVTNMASMFRNCYRVTELDVSGFDTSKVTSMSDMFYECNTIVKLDVSRWNTGNVGNFTRIFRSCYRLAELDVSGFNTSKATQMGAMFQHCYALKELNINGWDTSKVRATHNMFNDSGLTKLDLSNWNTSQMTDTRWMFSSCGSLVELNIEGFNFSNVTSGADMFSGDSSLKRVVLGSNFKFVSNLPTPAGTFATGRWTRVDDSCEPYGEAFTSSELAAAYNGNKDYYSGTWVWEEADFTIHFDANGGSGSMADQPVVSGNFTLSKSEFVSSDPLKVFAGWSNTPNGRVMFLDENSVYCRSRMLYGGGTAQFTDASGGLYTNFETTLYAVYAPANYRITYQLNDADIAEGATGAMQPEIVEAGKSHRIPAAKFYKKGYYVSYWRVAQLLDQNNNVVPSTRSYYVGSGDGSALISAMDFMGGDQVILEPVFVKAGSGQSVNGVIEVKLKGGQAVVYPNAFPGGTEYEVYEETPDGWKLVARSGNKGTIEPNEIAVATFVNEAKEVPEVEAKVSLNATKLLQSESGENQELWPDRFKFELYEGIYDEAKMPLQTTTCDYSGAISFKDVGISEAGTHTFTIVEVEGSEEGVEYTTELVTATVEVIEGIDGDGQPTLVASEPTYSPEDATFVNTVKEPTTHTLTINKVAENASADTTFTFEVSLTDARGQGLPAGTLLTVDGDDAPLATAGKLTVRVKGAGSVTIGEIPDGTQYAISETNLPNGWALAGAEGDSGTLQGETPQAAEATITNEYTPTGKVTLKAHKTFEGGELAAGDFLFELRDPSGTAIQQRENGAPNAGGVAPITFDAVELTAAGDYTYTITEVTGDDATIEYDATEVTASFTMTDNGDGTLTAGEVTYSPEDATFVNTKKPGELRITKTIEGAAPNASTAGFPVVVTLTDAEGTAVAGDFDWTSTTGGSGTVASGGTLTIHGDETITVSGLPGGTHYTAAEDTEAAKAQGFVQSGITGDEGTIAAGAASEVEITNTYLTATTATIRATKRLEGRELAEGAFAFQLRDADGNVVAEATNDEDGNVTFPEMAYSYADEGKTFTYAVSEVVPAEDGRVQGMTYDETEHEVTVTIAKGDDGGLSAEVSYADGGAPTFSNAYAATGKAKVEVTKELVGADISQAEGLFEFTLERPDGDALSRAEAKAQAPDGAQLKAANDASGKVSFREIAYDQDDAGKTYTYVVREARGKNAHIAYDAHACTVRVAVTDNGDGSLSTDVTYGNSTFKNTFDPGSRDVTVTKAWDDGEDADGIRPAGVSVRLLADGEAVGEAVTLSEANGWTHTWTGLPEAVFGAEIEYAVEELTDSVVTGTDGPGTYAIAVSTDAGGDFVVTNTHTPATTEVSAVKVWDDADDKDGIRPVGVSVQLFADGEACGDAVALSEDGGWAHTWTGLPKRAAGEEIAYTVDEVGAPDGYTRAVTGDAETGFVITNTHVPSPDVTTVTVTKVWDDGEDADGIRPDDVRVQLYADGEAMGEAVTLSAGNGWTHTWTDLPVEADGKAVTYTVDEVSVPKGYEKSVAHDTATGFVITNSHTPDVPPENPSTPGKPSSGTRLPKTGDLANPVVFAALAAVGIGAVAAGFLVRRRRKDDER